MNSLAMGACPSGTALSPFGSSRLLHGVSPASPLQSHGAETDPSVDWHTEYAVFCADQNRAQSIHGGLS